MIFLGNTQIQSAFQRTAISQYAAAETKISLPGTKTCICLPPGGGRSILSRYAQSPGDPRPLGVVRFGAVLCLLCASLLCLSRKLCFLGLGLFVDSSSRGLVGSAISWRLSPAHHNRLPFRRPHTRTTRALLGKKGSRIVVRGQVSRGSLV